MAHLTSNAGLFQSLDKWVGGAACVVCTILSWITRLLPSGTAKRQGLLFVKLAEQGSTVLAASAIHDAVQRYGRERVYFVVFEENRFILDTLDFVPRENVLFIRTGSLVQMVVSALSRLAQIHRMKFEALVDLEFFSRSTAAFSYLTGIPKRAGFHAYHSEGPWRGSFFSHRPRYNPHLHTSDTFRSLVAALEADPSAFPRFPWRPAAATPYTLPAFRPEPGEEAAMRSLIAESCKKPPAALVLLNANASDLLPLRRWANANYIALARRILAISDDYYVAFTGGPSEASKTRQIVAEIGSERAFCTAGRTTLRELLALYQMADVLVTNDSGPAHFAALTDIHTVVLFGPETPRLFGSLSSRNRTISAGLACSPCVSALNNRETSCTNNICMQSISVDAVFSLVAEALEERGKPAQPPAGAVAPTALGLPR